MSILVFAAELGIVLEDIGLIVVGIFVPLAGLFLFGLQLGDAALSAGGPPTRRIGGIK